MTNTYYNPTGAPAKETRGLSVILREELNAIQTGFDEIETALATNGIVFPATQVPGATANTIDDYEEGLSSTSWVPALPAASGLVLTNASGQYIKIGRMVFVQGYFTFPVTTNATITNAYITGFPFASALNSSLSIGQVTGGSSLYVRATLFAGTPTMQISKPGATRAMPSDLSGLSYHISGCYIASA